MKHSSPVLLALILALFAFGGVTFAQTAAISPLKLLPGDSTLGAAYGDQESPSIAKGGNMFLAAWTDSRTVASVGGSGQDIYAARLDGTGKLLDANPIVVVQGAAAQSNPRVAWNGTNWLVVWQSQERTASYWAMQVLAARVSPQGTLLDPTPIRVTNYTNSSALYFSASSDGSNWLVISEGTSGGEAATRGFRISPAGKLLDTGGVVLLPETYFVRADLDVAFASNEYLLIWSEWRTSSNDTLGVRVSTSLQVLDANPIVIAASPDSDFNGRVASDGASFFVVDERYGCCAGGQVYGTRVTSSGQVLDPNGIAISGDVGDTTGRHTSAAWDGVNWDVSWTAPSISVGQVSPNGIVLKLGGYPIDPNSLATKDLSSIAGMNGGGAQVVWTDYRAAGSSPKDVYIATMAPNGQPGTGSALSLGAPAQLALKLAAKGDGYLAVFVSAGSGVRWIKGQRLDAAGNPIEAEPFVIAQGDTTLANPAVAWDGSLYLVVWESASSIYGRRVAADGSLIDPLPILIMPGNEPRVAALADTFLVVGDNSPNDPHFRFIYSTRVRGSDGVILDPTPVLVGQSFSLHPDVTALGKRWLAVWEAHPSHDNPVAQIVGAFVNPDGTAGLSFVASGPPLSSFLYNPAVASSTGQALIVWEEPRRSLTNWNIYSQRIQSDGTLLDGSGLEVDTLLNNQGHAAVASIGQAYGVAYEDQHVDSFFLDTRTDVYGGRVSTAGKVLDPNGIALMNSALPEILPAVAGASGRAVVGASVFTDKAPYSAYHIGIRVIGP